MVDHLHYPLPIMREHLKSLKAWQDEGTRSAIARVIKTWGSAPRPVGSVMLINEHGKMVGSVSGGCVEGDIVKASKEVFEKGEAKQLHYGVSDEDAWSVGLSCGGNLQVFLQPFFENEWENKLLQNLESNTPCILVSELADGPSNTTLITLGKNDTSLLGSPLEETLIATAKEAYDQRTHKIFEKSDRSYFIQVLPRKSQLIIVGAAHITADLVELRQTHDFETIVIDPRGFFAKNTNFKVPPDQIIEAYPSEVLDNITLDAYTYCAILSHDPKIDDNALEILLPSPVAYIGALGSRKTHTKRIARLKEKGVSEEAIDRIHAPIGLSINAKSAKEIALSVMGEIIQMKNKHL